MGNLLHSMMSLWLAVALIAAPLSTYAYTTAPQSANHCLTMKAHADTTHTIPACKHCQDNVCDDNACSDASCFYGHGTSMAVLSNSILIFTLNEAPLSEPERILPSRTESPPLRPPV